MGSFLPTYKKTMHYNNSKHERIPTWQESPVKKKRDSVSGIKHLCSKKLSHRHTKQTSAGLHIGGEFQGMISHNMSQNSHLRQNHERTRTHTHTWTTCRAAVLPTLVQCDNRRAFSPKPRFFHALTSLLSRGSTSHQFMAQKTPQRMSDSFGSNFDFGFPLCRLPSADFPNPSDQITSDGHKGTSWHANTLKKRKKITHPTSFIQ